MFMRFRGGGVGHTSTRAATDTFKSDRDGLDIQSRQARNEAFNVEDEEAIGDDDVEATIEGANAEDFDQEGELSESELIDYGYEPENESDEDEEEPEDEEDRDAGEEDDTTIDELGILGYADY